MEKNQKIASGTEKNQPMKAQGISRRSILSGIWIGVGLVALLEGIAVMVAFFNPRKTRARTMSATGLFEAGPVDRFVPGTVTAFVSGKFYLARLKDGGFIALSRKCTHLGCALPWHADKQKFVCPCHASAFDIKGQVISPPASRALDMYRVAIENNVVKVDTGSIKRRSEFRPEQITYPRTV